MSVKPSLLVTLTISSVCILHLDVLDNTKDGACHEETQLGDVADEQPTITVDKADLYRRLEREYSTCRWPKLALKAAREP